MLYWDKYARPAMPVKTGVSTTLWWYDAERAAALERVIDDLDTTADTPARDDPPGWGPTLTWILAGIIILYWLMRRALRAKD